MVSIASSISVLKTEMPGNPSWFRSTLKSSIINSNDSQAFLWVLIEFLMTNTKITKNNGIKNNAVVPSVRLNISTIFGKTNLVANTTIVKGDLRFLTEEQRERAQKKMEAIVAENLPRTEAEITFNEEYYPSMPPTEGNMRILQVLSQVSQDLGHGEVTPYDPAKRGAGDISFVAQYIDSLDGLGVIGGGAHAPGEYVHLPTIQDIVKRTAILIHRLTNSK